MMAEYLSLDEIKQEELKILIYFDKFCKEHNLQYSLAGGTLLGAVRHKGFIPWDDDIDVCMPRPDYERFLKIFKEDDYFALEGYGRVGLAEYPCMKLVNKKIKVQEKVREEASNLWIDIFPVDGLPENGTSKIYKKATFIRKIYTATTASRSASKSQLKNIVKMGIKPLLKVAKIDVFTSHLLNKLAKKYEYGSTKYVGIITWGMYGTGERISYEGFRQSIPLIFENHQFKAMSNYDEYLSGVYGDYMQLPPIEQRKVHGIKAWRI